MGDVFFKLLNMSITAGWIILAVMCVHILFRNMPKWIYCALWGLVAIRLIVPFSIESVFSLQPSAQPIQLHTIAEGEERYYVPSVDSKLPIVEHTINPMLEETFTAQEAEQLVSIHSIKEIAGYVWFWGMLALGLLAVWSVLRLRLLVTEAVCYKNNVYICDAVKSPFIFGLIEPRIYLPSDANESDIDYMIAHEKAHISRKDHLWKPLGYFLLSVYWFQPLCWIAYAMLCKDIELACDEKVIKHMSFADKKEYSKVLLSCATQRSVVMVCPLAFGDVGVKERVKTILNYKKPAFWITIAAIILAVILSVCFLTNPSREYQIRITIPAGSTLPYCFSEEEISPLTDTVTLWVGQDVGDSSIVLKPIEVKEEKEYQPTYITPGMPCKMEVEKGGWYKIGLGIQNTTMEDIDVYVTVDNVEVRIADEDSNKKLAEGLVGDLAYYLELSASDITFKDMSEHRKSEILAEYENLLDGYTFTARESTDGKSAYITGYYQGDITQNPLREMYTMEYGDGSLQRDFQILYLAENDTVVNAALEEKGVLAIDTEGYVVEHSRIYWSVDGASIFIQPVDSVQNFLDTFLIYFDPNRGPSYIKDALRRGLVLNTPEEPYLSVYEVSGTYGEITENIPLTEQEALEILAADSQKLTEGYGFSAALHMNGETKLYSQDSVPQVVVDLAVKKCGYQFATPEDIISIKEASLDCSWLKEPILLDEVYLEQLEKILKSAEFTGVGNCGYAATLILSLENGECITLEKGTDDCGSIVFGSYGGYSISDEADDAFWEMFGLSANVEERLGLESK